MTEPLNLNRARKQRTRAERKALADENAARHGLSKAERLFAAARTERARKMLDRHRMDDDT